ncbi:MAG: hypothetical protein IPL33_13550 [Sphingobacteriales bacterium]|nr:hypothetical protein [Sphingobacteriales bacterium]MCC7224581.1 hypothetical protein [Chitinophagales bacterium]
MLNAFITAIDFVGRFFTAREIGKYLLNATNALNESDQNRIRQHIADGKAEGMSQKLAETHALWLMGMVSTQYYNQVRSEERR